MNQKEYYTYKLYLFLKDFILFIPYLVWYIKSKSWKFSLIKGEERGNKCIFYADQTSTICQSSNVWQVGIDCSRPKCSEAV